MPLFFDGAFVCFIVYNTIDRLPNLSVVELQNKLFTARKRSFFSLLLICCSQFPRVGMRVNDFKMLCRNNYNP